MTAPNAAQSSLNLRVLLEEMIERGASDLHITAGERPKVRVDGDITNSNVDIVLQPKDCMQLAYSVLTENQKKKVKLGAMVSLPICLLKLKWIRILKLLSLDLPLKTIQ